jgi:hypothetical protein
MEIGKAALEWSPARGNDVAGRPERRQARPHQSRIRPSTACLARSKTQWTVEGDGVMTSDTMMDMVFCYWVSLQDGMGEAHAKQGRRDGERRLMMSSHPHRARSRWLAWWWIPRRRSRDPGSPSTRSSSSAVSAQGLEKGTATSY